MSENNEEREYHLLITESPEGITTMSGNGAPQDMYRLVLEALIHLSQKAGMPKNEMVHIVLDIADEVYDKKEEIEIDTSLIEQFLNEKGLLNDGE